MYGEKLFVRTPKGDEALARRGLQDLSYKVHMVLNLCDGTNRYNFLASNLKRVENLADIVQHLLENGLIEEVTEQSRKRMSLGRSPFARKAAPAEPVAPRAPAAGPAHTAEAGRGATSGAEDNRDFFRAISKMNEALSETFSDEVLEWSMQAEGCSNHEEFEQLLKSFEALYGKNTSRARASEFVKELRREP